jgi:uncharacterized membrane protein
MGHEIVKIATTFGQYSGYPFDAMTPDDDAKFSGEPVGAPPGPTRSPNRLWRHLRGWFFAGVLVTAPLGLTIYIVWVVIHWIDNQITPLIPRSYSPENYLPFYVPGLGLVIAFLALTLVGALTAGLFGRLWITTTEHLLARMPIVRSVYSAIKQIFETIFRQQSQAFREVVLFQYPRPGIWTLGFITGVTKGEVQSRTGDELVNVFVPTTPNPTSGFLLFVPRKDVTVLGMSVEDGIKMVVSGGILTPPDDSRQTGLRNSRPVVVAPDIPKSMGSA